MDRQDVARQLQAFRENPGAGVVTVMEDANLPADAMITLIEGAALYAAREEREGGDIADTVAAAFMAGIALGAGHAQSVNRTAELAQAMVRLLTEDLPVATPPSDRRRPRRPGKGRRHG